MAQGSQERIEYIVRGSLGEGGSICGYEEAIIHAGQRLSSAAALRSLTYLSVTLHPCFASEPNIVILLLLAS